MSTTDFARFMAKTGSDPEATKAFVLAIGDRQGDEAVRAVATFAQAQGFAVTAEDAAKARESVLAANATNRDLSDHELGGVDGGILVESAIILGAAVGGTVAIATGGATIGILSSVPSVQEWFKQW